MSGEIILYDYWRSSACFRLRIALNLKGLEYRIVPVDFMKREQWSEEHLARNPQGYVPVLEIDGRRMTQSLAIIEYLEETRPEFPFLPTISAERQKVRALAHIIAMDIHPVCNSNVADYAAGWQEGDPAARIEWMQHFIGRGLAALEQQVLKDTAFCAGDSPGLADICLVPQLYNARRWDVDMRELGRLSEIDENCRKLEAFSRAAPDRVKAQTVQA